MRNTSLSLSINRTYRSTDFDVELKKSIESWVTIYRKFRRRFVYLLVFYIILKKFHTHRLNVILQ
jgi:hypothetical protein